MDPEHRQGLRWPRWPPRGVAVTPEVRPKRGIYSLASWPRKLMDNGKSINPWTSMKIHENPLKCSISCDDFPIFHWTFAISIDLQQGLGPNTWTLVSRRSVWGPWRRMGREWWEDNCAFAMKSRNLVGFPFKQDYTMVCLHLDNTLCYNSFSIYLWFWW